MVVLCAAINNRINIKQLIRISDNREACVKRRRSLQPDEAPRDQMRTPSHQPRTLRLTAINAHPRDTRVVFEEDSHVYYLDGIHKFPRSVSKVWGSFFEEFDAPGIIEKYFVSWSKKTSSKYFGIIQDGRIAGKSDDQIKLDIAGAWKQKGLDASTKGTYMHLQIELFLNGCACDTSMPEFQQFKDFLNEFATARGWVPFRTEWSIYDERHWVAGQIDSVFEDSDGGFHMVDWKRVEADLDPQAGQHFGHYGTPPCDKMLDNSFNHYALQQNLYATILADCYGLRVSSMWLLQFHEARHSYNAVNIPFFIGTARTMIRLCSGLGGDYPMVFRSTATAVDLVNHSPFDEQPVKHKELSGVVWVTKKLELP